MGKVEKLLKFGQMGALLIFAVSGRAFAIGEVAQTFTLDGTLYADAAGTTPLADSSTAAKIQILDNGQTCILYEETQAFSTLITNGKFNIQIGSALGAAKRSGGDPNHTMAQVYSNAAVAITGTKVSDGTACSITPAAGDQRYTRVTISATSIGSQILSPNLAVDSVPLGDGRADRPGPYSVESFAGQHDHGFTFAKQFGGGVYGNEPPDPYKSFNERRQWLRRDRR